MRAPHARTVIALLLFWGSFFGASPAAAGEAGPGPPPAPLLYGFRAGVLAHDVNHLWSRKRAEGGVDWNAELVFGRPGWAFGAGMVLANIGASVNSRGDTSKIYGGFLWEAMFGGMFFFNTGAGLALHDGDLEREDPDRKQLGSRLLFRVPLEVGVSWSGRHRLSLMFDHVSNAYLASPNEGLDTLGLRYGFQF
ncbi:MAG: acyloxyacyl hydrolase [Desulfobacterales bacterium]